MKLIPEEDWTPGMGQIVRYAKRLFKEWFGHDIEVRIANETHWGDGVVATYGSDHILTLNAGRLGRAWFSAGVTISVRKLLIHEGGHEYELDHLSKAYHDALCDLGARMGDLKYLEAEDGQV